MKPVNQYMFQLERQVAQLEAAYQACYNTLQRERKERQEDNEWRTEYKLKKSAAELRRANTWLEAIDKQILLFSAEIGDDDYERSSAFAGGLKALERARKLWLEAREELDPEYAKLRKEFAQLEDKVRFSVADKLDQENETNSWQQIAKDLREFDEPSAWLEW